MTLKSVALILEDKSEKPSLTLWRRPNSLFLRTASPACLSLFLCLSLGPWWRVRNCRLRAGTGAGGPLDQPLGCSRFRAPPVPQGYLLQFIWGTNHTICNTCPNTYLCFLPTVLTSPQIRSSEVGEGEVHKISQKAPGLRKQQEALWRHLTLLTWNRVCFLLPPSLPSALFSLLSSYFVPDTLCSLIPLQPQAWYLLQGHQLGTCPGPHYQQQSDSECGCAPCKAVSPSVSAISTR